MKFIILFLSLLSVITATKWLTERVPDSERQNQLIFVKTHKTGGSTVSSILHRYCDEHGITCYTAGPIEHSRDVVEGSERWFRSLHFPKVDIYTYHTRYWPVILQKYVSNVPIITIVREPVSRFLSGWDYKPKDWRGRTDILNIVREMPDDVESLPEDFNKLLHANCIQQELCPDEPAWAVRNASEPTCIQTLRDMHNGALSLVMVTELMDESLVLLSRMMGWTLHEILYLSMKNNSLISSKHDHPPKDVAEKIKGWLKDDVLIYEEALKLLQERIAAQDSEFHMELLKFKSMKLLAHMNCNPTKVEHTHHIIVDECTCRIMKLDHADWVRKHIKSKRQLPISTKSRRGKWDKILPPREKSVELDCEKRVTSLL